MQKLHGGLDKFFWLLEPPANERTLYMAETSEV
jgi:hypothetical protein